MCANRIKRKLVGCHYDGSHVWNFQRTFFRCASCADHFAENKNFYNLNIWIQRGKFHFNIAGNTSLFFLEEKERQKFHASSSKTAVGNQIDRPNKANINIDTIPLNVTTLKHAYIEWWENRWFLWMIMAVRYSSRTTWIVHFMVFAIINIFFASWLRAPPIIHEYVRVMRRRKDKCVDLIQFRAIWRVFMNQLERRTTSLAVVTSHCLIDFFFVQVVNAVRGESTESLALSQIFQFQNRHWLAWKLSHLARTVLKLACTYDAYTTGNGYIKLHDK